MRVVFRQLAALALLLLVTVPAFPASAGSGRLVLAFYYAWFEPASFGPGKTSDVPPLPYRSSDRATIERQVSQAKGAGIDAFVQSWYGPRDGPDNQTESNFRTLLDVAQASGFRAAVDVEVGGPFFAGPGDVQTALSSLLATHARHPAYLKVDERPVVFFWYNSRFGVEQWAAIRNVVDPDHTSIWIGEGTDAEYLRVFDGHHLYSITWSADPQSTLNVWGQRVRAKAAELGQPRIWVGTVMPGWNDLALGRSNSYIRARDDGTYYRASFAGAASSGADWVVITSFNEWPEGTMIEPSVSYGDTYLNLTRQLVAAFKGMADPALAAPAVPPAAVAPVPTPSPSPTATATASATPSARPTAATTLTVPTATPWSTPSPTPVAAATPTGSLSSMLRATETPRSSVGQAAGEIPAGPLGALLLVLSTAAASAWRGRRARGR